MGTSPRSGSPPVDAMRELCRVSSSVSISSVGDIGSGARGVTLAFSHVSYVSRVGMQRHEGREVGAVLVEDGVGGGEGAPKQERLAVAAGKDVGKLVSSGDAPGTLRPEGV